MNQQIPLSKFLYVNVETYIAFSVDILVFLFACDPHISLTVINVNTVSLYYLFIYFCQLDGSQQMPL